MIRTLAEVRSENVTVTVTVDDATSNPLTIDRVQKAVDVDEVERLSRHVRELGDRLLEMDTQHLAETDGLRAEIRKLRAQVQGYDNDRKTEQERADQNKGWAQRAEARLEEVKARADQAQARLDKSRETIKELRALLTQKEEALTQAANDLAVSQNHVRELRQSVEARDGLLTATSGAADALSAKVGAVRGAVHSADILVALSTDWTAWSGTQVAALANAVRDVRRIVGEPEPDSSGA